MPIRAWLYLTKEWLSTHGEEVLAHSSAAQYTNFMILCSTLQRNQFPREEGQEPSKEMSQTRLQDMDIWYQTSGKEDLINTLR